LYVLSVPGDLGPYQDQEFAFEVIVAIIGSIMGALLCGSIGNMQFERDNTGDNAFKEKIRRVKTFIGYRQLAPQLGDSIFNHYQYTWVKERNLGDRNSSFLSLLSRPLAAEVSLVLHGDIFKSVPLLQSWKESIQRNLAFAMRPQVR
jgi:hypothetical protein